MTTPLSLDASIQWMGWIAGTGLTLSAVQQLLTWRDYRPGELFDWGVLRLTYMHVSRRYFRILSAFLGAKGFLGLLVFRLAGLSLFFLSSDQVVQAAGLTAVLISLLLAGFRYRYGQDGSDQMFLLLTTALTLRWWFTSSPGVDQVCLWFVALQATLAYTVSGLAKVISPTWRSGRAVAGIFNTRQYGHHQIATLLARRPGVSRLVAWGVFGFEVAFPLAFLFGFPTVWVFIAVAFLFHIACAVVMGLDQFVWAFAATYPAILYAVGAIHPS
jgi:hypothetical protein